MINEIFRIIIYFMMFQEFTCGRKNKVLLMKDIMSNKN